MAGEIDGKILDIFIAGDDEEAKRTVSDMVKSCGLRPLDVGSLVNAQLTEAMQVIHFKVQSQLGNTWMTTKKVIS